MGLFKRRVSHSQNDFVLQQLSMTSHNSIRDASGLKICEEIVDLRFEDTRFVNHYDYLLAKAAEAFALARKCGWTSESLALFFEQISEKIYGELNRKVIEALKISVWDVRVDLEQHLTFSPVAGNAKKWAEMTAFGEDFNSPVWIVLEPKPTHNINNYLGDPVNVGDLGRDFSRIQAICKAIKPITMKQLSLPSGALPEHQSLVSDVRKVRPAPQPFGVSPLGAEHYCAQWMDFLGFEDVVVTESTRDGGYDIRAKGFVAQVKNFTHGKVSVVDVRQIYGVAQHLKVSAIVFSSTGATSDAQTFCNEAGIGLFQFNSEAGSLWAVNSTAVSVLQLIEREVERKQGLVRLIQKIETPYMEALGDFREIANAMGALLSLHTFLPASIASLVSDFARLVRVFDHEVKVELIADASLPAEPRLEAMVRFSAKYPAFQTAVQELLSKFDDLENIYREKLEPSEGNGEQS
jgi:hypothetical protein